MANKKLTLSIDSEVIEAAKKFAANSDESLSSMVENFFINLINFKSSKKKLGDSKISFSADLQKIRGIVKIPNNFDLKKAKVKRLNKKYL